MVSILLMISIVLTLYDQGDWLMATKINDDQNFDSNNQLYNIK